MSFLGLLVQSGDFQEASITRSSTGEETETWTSRKVAPCLVQLAGRPADIQWGMQEGAQHIIFAEVYPEIRTGRWRIIVGGIEYRVVDSRDPGGRGHHYEVLARRVS